MNTVNLVITFENKKVIEKFNDSDSAIVRFEEAKHLGGVKSLFMTFSNGSSWSWKNNEMEIREQHPKLSDLIAQSENKKNSLLQGRVQSRNSGLDLVLSDSVQDR